MNFLFVTTLALSATFTNGSSLRKGRKMQSADVFPLYNQQCRDDAGPLYIDDSETFGNTRYHEGKPAFAVGDCPDPLKGACAQKSKTAAFLEGPVDCGGKGWFCRILEEPNWPNVNLNTDVNFAYCNITQGFNEDGFDQSGHCHGSDSDDTFYWWVRDHWFRQYNGRLRCCCGWDDNVTEGTIVNSCDYRRLVTQDEKLDDCRDANEEGVTPYRGGCASNNAPTLNETIPENDAMCWEVQKFGEPCDDNCGGGEEPENEENDPENENEEEDEEDNEEKDNEVEDNEDNYNEDEDNQNEDEDNQDNEENEEDNEDEEDNEENEDEDNEKNDNEDEDNEDNEDNHNEDEDYEDNEDNEDENNENCEDDGSFLFKGKDNEDCEWIGKIAKRTEKLCPKNSNGKKVAESCPVTCRKCSDDNEDNEGNEDNDNDSGCEDDSTFVFRGQQKKNCRWIEKNPTFCNKKSDGIKVSVACPVACIACESLLSRARVAS